MIHTVEPYDDGNGRTNIIALKLEPEQINGKL
jgi:hypothetical protein